MSRSRFSRRHFAAGLMLTAILVISMTVMAGAQGPDNGEPARPAPAIANAGTVVDELELQPGVQAAPAALNFKFYAASSFVPYDSDMTYHYAGAGCVYRTGGQPFSEQSLQLPQGAVVDYMRIYYYDNDAVNNASAFLFAFDGMGNYTQIASVSSTGTPGQSSTGSGFFAYPVDNIDSALGMRLSYGGGTTTNLRICGVRLRYQYSLSTVSLPLILRKNAQ